MRIVVVLLLAAACAHGQITGTVRDSASKLPVPGVRISMAGWGAKFVESSATGEFLLEDARPGRHMVVFRKRGYDDGNVTVEVKADGATLALEINPWAEMEGVVRDEDGNPLAGVRVYVGGLRDTTGKDGRYRAQEISCGQYTLTFRLPDELRHTTAVHDGKTGETFGYGYTVDSDLPLTIEPGARIANFDVRLRRTRLVEIKGKLVDGLADTEIELDSVNGLPEGTYGKRKLDEARGFHFELLEPGEYTVVAHRNGAGDDLPYLTAIHLGEASVQDLEVVLPPFARIEGTVRMARADVKWEGTLRVTLGRLGYDTEVRVGTEGHFVLNAIPPGEWNLAVDASVTHRADDPARKLYVIGLSSKLRVTESGNPPLEIVLTDETGQITGTVEDPGPVLVTVTPDGGAISSWRVAQSRANGAFFVDVAPGEYRVAVAECAKKAEKVTVPSGGSVSVHLKACGGSGN